MVHSLEVDRYDEETKEVFQFDGCFFHSCAICSTNRNANRNADGSLEEIHPLNGKKHEDIQKATVENTKILEEAGYAVRRIRECEKRLKKQTEVAANIKT